METVTVESLEAALVLAATSPPKVIPEKVEPRVPDFVRGTRDATLIKNAICLMGSSVEKEKHNDVDILIKIANPPDYLKRAIETRIYKMFPDEVTDKLHFTWGDPEGPHDSHVPLFDLSLVALKPKVIRMNAAGLLNPFYPMKPKTRFYEPKDSIEFCFSKYDIWAAEKKFTGFRAVVHKEGDEIKVYSDQKKDITSVCPIIVKQAKAASSSDFVVDCEMAPYSGREPMGRNIAAQYIEAAQSGKEIKGYDLVFHVFDCLYFNEDITDLPWNKRREFLERLRFGSDFRLVHSIIVDNKDEMYKAIRMFSNMKGSEGCVLKRFDGTYAPNAETDDWVKYRTLLLIRATVLAENPVKGETEGRNYEIGVALSKKDLDKINPEYVTELNGVKYLKLGNTFNTSIVAQPSQVLDLLVEEVWRHKYQDDTYHYSLHKVTVKDISTMTRGSTIADLDAYAVGRGVEVEAWQDFEFEDTGTPDVGGTGFPASSLSPVKIKKKKEQLMETEIDGGD